MLLLNKLKIKLSSIALDQDGAALAEFALILPLLAILFMGLIEFGFIINEWRRLNDLVEAQVLYLSTSNNSKPTNAEQLNASTTLSTNTIINAVNEVNSRILAANATPSVTLGCGCPSGSGASATITFSTSYTPPSCPPPPDQTCTGDSRWYAYADVKASKTHTGFFINTTWLPSMSAHALVRIF